MNAPTMFATDADYRRLTGLLATMEGQNGREHANSRANDLRRELEGAVVVPPDVIPYHVITMHSRFRLKDLDTGEVREYTLVFPDEADVREGKLSVLTPIGTALFGSGDLDVVEWEAPAGRKRFRVNAIFYQPEAVEACRVRADSLIRGSGRASRRPGKSFRASRR